MFSDLVGYPSGTRSQLPLDRLLRSLGRRTMEFGIGAVGNFAGMQLRWLLAWTITGPPPPSGPGRGPPSGQQRAVRVHRSCRCLRAPSRWAGSDCISWQSDPLWLGEEEGAPSALLRPSAAELRVWRIGTAVNSVRNDNAALLEPV